MNLISLLLVSALGGQNVLVVLDGSGSMSYRMAGGSSRMEVAKKAVASMVSKLPADTKLGIVCFGNTNDWVYPLSKIDKSKVASEVAKIQPDGGTPLGQYMKYGADALIELRKKEHYGDYRLLVITDGEASDVWAMEKNFADILKKGITVDVIGVDMASTHTLANRANTYRNAANPADLAKALESVFAETSKSKDDESDFEAIASLPPELAQAIVKNVAFEDNSFIGEVLPTPPAATNPQSNNQQPNQGNQANSSSAGFYIMAFVGGFICFLFICAFICTLNANR